MRQPLPFTLPVLRNSSNAEGKGWLGRLRQTHVCTRYTPQSHAVQQVTLSLQLLYYATHWSLVEFASQHTQYMQIHHNTLVQRL